MNNAVTEQNKGSLIEQVLIKGDLASLSPQERSNYYMKVCDSVGLNHLTKPFEYITLNNKLTLYALRGCTDQLRSIHKVSVEELIESEREGVFVVTAKVKNGEGRTDIAKGAVNISGLKGESLANALMKAETKAKRRATLSICGLGMLDETEIETIPGARPEPMKNVTPSETDSSKPVSPFKTATLRNTFQKNVTDGFHNAKSTNELLALLALDKAKLADMEASGDERDQLSLGEIRKQYQVAWNRIVIATRETAEPDDTFDRDEIEASRVAAEFATPPEFLNRGV